MNFKIGKYYFNISNRNEIQYYQCINLNKDYVWMKDINGTITKYKNHNSLFKKVSIFKKDYVENLFKMKG